MSVLLPEAAVHRGGQRRTGAQQRQIPCPQTLASSGRGRVPQVRRLWAPHSVLPPATEKNALGFKPGYRVPLFFSPRHQGQSDLVPFTRKRVPPDTLALRQTLLATTARRKIHQTPKRILGRSVFPLANDVLLRVPHGPLPLQGELTD